MDTLKQTQIVEDNTTEDIKENTEIGATDAYPFSDLKYICQASSLITKSVRQGFDIAQLPNGDIIVTEIKVFNVHYSWDSVKQKFAKTNQS